MDGEPKALPSNHVEWANGFKSNMPDWKTARRCAHSHRLLFALKEARTALLAADMLPNEDWRCRMGHDRFSQILSEVMFCIDIAEGMDVVKKAHTMPPPPGFPKPPGVI